MRLFISVDFSEEILEVLRDSIDQLKHQCRSANFTREENLHLTLAFIGETQRSEAAVRAMKRINMDSFPLTLNGFGHFGDLFWIGTEKNAALHRLASNVKEELLDEDFDIDRKKFSPHITVARRVRPQSALGKIHLSVPRTSMTVKGFSLMESRRYEGKLIYREIFWKSLG